MKNIVICLDGTGNQVKGRGNTNVEHLYEMLDLTDPSRQIAYYDPGVGTLSSPGAWSPTGRWLTRMFGLTFGMGLRTNLGEAYGYLMRHYEPGDRVFVFGFSRGAYTSLALAGLLRAIGLLRPGSENLVPYAVASYSRRSGKLSDDDWNEMHRFGNSFSRTIDQKMPLRIHYLGVWDTVKAAGVLRWDLHWPWTRALPNVSHGRHAVSIDERRRPYREYLLTPGKGGYPGPIEEAWFAGVHSDIGGSFEDHPGLGQITLHWIVEDAVTRGLLLHDGAPRVVPATAALDRTHKMSWPWVIFTVRRRPIPDDAKIHSSVKYRMSALPDYLPDIPDGVTWVDPLWCSHDRS